MYKPAITTTTTHATPTQGNLFETFSFSDGATLHVNGGLVCSQHGRRHCTHHNLAHAAIITLASSQEEVTATCRECGDALRSDNTGPYCEWCAPIQPALKMNAGVPLSDEAADEFNAWLDSIDAASPLPLPPVDDPEPDPNPAPPFEEQVESLLGDLEPRIQRLARHLAATYHYLSPRIEAEDLAAEARLEVLETLTWYQFNGRVIENPIPYFHRVARNTMADYCNRYGSLIRTPLIHLGHGRFHPWMRVESMQAMEEHAAALRGC